MCNIIILLLLLGCSRNCGCGDSRYSCDNDGDYRSDDNYDCDDDNDHRRSGDNNCGCGDNNDYNDYRQSNDNDYRRGNDNDYRRGKDSDYRRSDNRGNNDCACSACEESTSDASPIKEREDIWSPYLSASGKQNK